MRSEEHVFVRFRTGGVRLVEGLKTDTTPTAAEILFGLMLRGVADIK